MNQSWKPTATLANIHARAELLHSIRQFFADREVIEVETPLLSNGTVTDVHLAAFSTQFNYAKDGTDKTLYLQTSPEYAMKRLLCAEVGPCYQIGKAFRHEGEGRWHNPEFTMLEWYRPGFDHHRLMDEMDDLLTLILGVSQAQRKSYQQVFAETLGIDPLTVSIESLQQTLCEQHIDVHGNDVLDKDAMLQLLFSYKIEPIIGQEEPCFVYGFPASQAALAKLSQNDRRVADRFEVYFKGIELANGFNELGDAQEQRRRFDNDIEQRKSLGLPVVESDERFLAALECGLPPCAGVALGVDRLLMLKTGANHIDQVISFPVSRA
ncbi:elongation factor P--(R)-beta-lysine ligase [Alteromonas sp. ASW11-130]|uniref:elongation factor P--(R)-beta-lysine ligase n=1 Tax=Alteromonas sp. ASW11-130 TaxID=3015775 RepID=UPI00224257CD|nr:elongation factor P--(R)-beta-lysine ligase [Alteromonas sp. ASW11-130]MCW8090536.1 elongation factor P--(R)-beta-lysine ligase [Alteromonas sp. ASW11-130]